jgi:2'-5' RNA ligase
MIRLFVAIELPTDLKQRIGPLCTGIQGARWVGEDNMHLTLRFIGEVGEERFDDIAGALAQVNGAPFALTLTGAGHFETRRRVRTLWLGVEKQPALFALQELIESALVRAGQAPEGRNFNAHVTLARLRDARTARVRDWLGANSAFRATPFRVEKFVLYSSLLGRGGAVHQPEQEYPLGRDTA